MHTGTSPKSGKDSQATEVPKDVIDASMAVDAHVDTSRDSSSFSISLQVFALLTYIVFERAAFFGFYTSAVQYLLDMYEMSTENVNVLVNAFSFLVYLLSVVGAVLADAKWGRWKISFSAGVVYLLGFVLVTLSSFEFCWREFPTSSGDASFSLFVTGLAFISVGNYGKTVYLAMLSEQAKSDSGNPKSVERVFLLITAACNLGPSVSIVVIPYLHTFGQGKVVGSERTGTSFYYSYLVCAVMFAVGFVFYVLRRSHYVNTGLPSSKSSFLKIFGAIRNGYRNRKLSKLRSEGKMSDEDNIVPVYEPTKSILLYCTGEYESVGSDLDRISHLILFFLFYISVFDFIYSQMTSSVLIQASWMSSPSWFSPSSVMVFETIFSVICSVLVDWLLNYLRARGCYVGPHLRIFIGFLVLSLAFGFYTGLQWYVVDANAVSVKNVYESDVSIWWQIPGQFLFGLGSTLVFASCQEYAAGVAPVYMKTAVLSLFNISFVFGTAASMAISPLINDSYIVYAFLGFAVVSLLVSFPYIYQFYGYDKKYEKVMNPCREETSRESS